MTRAKKASDPKTRATPSPDSIVIGLVNNMPDAALHTTERQFRELLGAASKGRDVVLKLFSFPEILRSEVAQSHIAEHYEPIGSLWSGHLDGLIVTGAEPRAARLSDEPYWESLTKVVTWASQRTASTVWSCLAAHAAAYSLDGIERQRLSGKLSGVFTCQKRLEHELIAGLPATYCVPHSRYNDLPEDALLGNGYQVLSNSPDVGADLFVKELGDSLFVFLQGHPEYDPRALYREYRRDTLRYLNQERDEHPSKPTGYFDEKTEAALDALRVCALADRDPAQISRVAAIEASGHFPHAWKNSATLLYSNWLDFLVRRQNSAAIVAPSARPNPSLSRDNYLPSVVSPSAPAGPPR